MAISRYRANGRIKYKAVLWRNGKSLISKSFPLSKDAKKWLAEQSLKTAQGFEKIEKIRLNDFYDQYYVKSLKIRFNTANDYKILFYKYISPTFGNYYLERIDRRHITVKLNEMLQNGLSPARANRVHTVFSAIFKLAVSLQFAQENPLKEVPWFSEGLKEMPYWSTTDAQRFFSGLISMDPEKYLLFRLAYETGLRFSEIIALEKCDVDLENGTIKVLKSYCKISKQVISNTKSGRIRVIPITPKMASLIAASAVEEGPMFSTGGKIWSYETIRCQFGRIQKNVGVRSIGFHGLRHTFASHYLMAGGGVYDLSKLLGHSTLEVTAKYAHSSPGHLKEQTLKISEFLSKLEKSVTAQP